MTYAENDYSQQQDNGGNENVTPDDIKAFLQENLSPEAFQRVEEMLTALMMQDQENQDPDNQEPDENSDPDFVAPGKAGFVGEFGNDPQGEDQPPAFMGKPRPGGAQDSAYYRRFPDARRLKIALDAGGHRPAPVASSAAYASYAARFGTVRHV
jgi:hypothetical protein